MEPPLISVILPTYNRAEMLGDALMSLLGQETGGEFNYEIVVVDNASTDATKVTVERMAARSPVPVRYLYHEVPGDAPSRNCGIAAARGAWLAFFDDDQLAAPDWLRQLYRATLETGAPIIGGAVRLDLPQATLDRLNSFVRRSSLREADYYPTVQPYTGKRLPGAGNALVARRVFTTVGMFDASKTNGGSDSDFFLRSKNAGLALYYTPHAAVRHRVAPNRLTAEYFRWDAQQGCDTIAGLDFKFKGRLMLVLLCLARIAQALLVVVPRLAWAWWLKDSAELLGQKVRLWRIEGYVRRTLTLLAPRWFPQERYFTRLTFRQGRTIGQHAPHVETFAG
jgi:glycosyltransferase involved in cell wall biosynthesis